MIQKQINEKIANAIKDFLLKYQISGDTRIYFNNICYNSVGYGENGTFETLEDIKASDYFDYANDDTVSLSFEGEFYNVMNYNYQSEYLQKLEGKFSKILESFGYYYELGNAWNLSIYKI